jgi:hypothetical protein
MILLPLIQALVRAAEESNVDGKVKKEVVSEQLKTSYEILKSTGSIKELNSVPWEAIAPVVIPIVDVLVSGYNRLGLFKHKKNK